MKVALRSGWRLFISQDWLALAAVLGLLAVGLTFIYSASWRGEETGIVGAWFDKQIGWVLLGGMAALVLMLLDYHIWIRYAWWGYLAAVILLVLVLFIGTRIYGAYRWLNVFGVLVQPS
ncbi:MAG: FtsW/RodA/SpoVE family cell cycle protein, partial [Verrucomicrobiota bacterium]|nr:FtsW/RodA/SpoVE family cell cycle protein [Verrucomicrobiota bacterium]